MEPTKTIAIDVLVNGVTASWCIPQPLTPLDGAEIVNDLKKASVLMGKYRDRPKKAPVAAGKVLSMKGKDGRYSPEIITRMRTMGKTMTPKQVSETLGLPYGSVWYVLNEFKKK